MVYYPLVLIELVLNFFADSDPRLSDYPPVEVQFTKHKNNFLVHISIIINQFLETMSRDESIISITCIIFLV